MIKGRKYFVAVVAIYCLVLLGFASVQMWKHAIWENKDFGATVSTIVAYIRAKREISRLESFETIQQAQSALESQGDVGPFIQSGSFGLFPEVDRYLVKEKNGWKIEDVFQFARGHIGITTGNGYYEVMARLVQDQWNIYIRFYDDQLHDCYSDGKRYILYPFEYKHDHSGRIYQITALTIPSSTKSFTVYIDGDYFVLQDQKWTLSAGSLCQGGDGSVDTF